MQICREHFHRARSGAQGVLPMMVRGVTSQLYLPSLTPLSTVGCGRPQLGESHLAISVDYYK